MAQGLHVRCQHLQNATTTGQRRQPPSRHKRNWFTRTISDRLIFVFFCFSFFLSSHWNPTPEFQKSKTNACNDWPVGKWNVKASIRFTLFWGGKWTPLTDGSFGSNFDQTRKCRNRQRPSQSSKTPRRIKFSGQTNALTFKQEIKSKLLRPLSLFHRLISRVQKQRRKRVQLEPEVLASVWACDDRRPAYLLQKNVLCGLRRRRRGVVQLEQ